MHAVSRLAGLAAVLTLGVVAASAVIRLGAGELGSTMPIARGVHRAAASIAALLVILLFWRALRAGEARRGASFALLLMLALSAVGWATGTQPPPAAALFNQLGGVALAALLAWLAGRASGSAGVAPSATPLAFAALLLAALQAVFGAALVALGPPVAPALLVAHAVSGLAAAAIGAALGVRVVTRADASSGAALLACAALVPLAGCLAVLSAPPFWVQASHATAAALLVAAVAQLHGRLLRSA